MSDVINFFNAPFFAVFGGISAIIAIIGFSYTAWTVIRGVIPVWYRLGIGLSKSKIAIFSKTECNGLESLLSDSNIFKKNNVIKIYNKNNIGMAESAKVFLVHWKDFSDSIDDILGIKKDSVALIVYAPQDQGMLDPTNLKKINDKRNSVIVNMRGRLMNDVFTALITAGYGK